MRCVRSESADSGSKWTSPSVRIRCPMAASRSNWKEPLERQHDEGALRVAAVGDQHADERAVLLALVDEEHALALFVEAREGAGADHAAARCDLSDQAQHRAPRLRLAALEQPARGGAHEHGQRQRRRGELREAHAERTEREHLVVGAQAAERHQRSEQERDRQRIGGEDGEQAHGHRRDVAEPAAEADQVFELAQQAVREQQRGDGEKADRGILERFSRQIAREGAGNPHGGVSYPRPDPLARWPSRPARIPSRRRRPRSASW